MKTGDLEGAKNSFDKAAKYRDTIYPEDALDKNIGEIDAALSTGYA